MDTTQPIRAILPDRPLLGVWVLVTCLAGGAATQNLAVVPHAVDRIDYKFDASGKMPAMPAVTIGAEHAPSALVAPPRFRQFRSLDRTIPGQAEGDLTAAFQTAEPVARSTVAVAPPSRPQAPALALAEPSPVLPLTAAISVTAPQQTPTIEAALAAPRTVATFDSAFAGLGTPEASVSSAEPATIAAPALTAAVPAIANPPGLRGFALARVVPSAARKPAALVLNRAAQPASSAPKPRSASARDRVLDATVYHPTTIMIGGQSAGRVDVRIGADMKPSIKVGDLLAMVSAQMDPELAAHLSVASGAADYVSFAMLRDAGFKVSYNAGADSVSIGVAD